MIKLCYKFLYLLFFLIAFYLLFIHALYSTCLVFNEVICYLQVFQDTGVYGSSTSQVLDLGVSEFCLCSRTHVLSLKSVQGFCHRIVKGGDCNSIQSFSCIFVGYNVRAVYKSLVKNCEDVDFANWSQLLTCETSHVKSTCWNLKSP